MKVNAIFLSFCDLLFGMFCPSVTGANAGAARRGTFVRRGGPIDAGDLLY